MRNGKRSSAEIALSELDKLAYWLLAEVEAARADAAPRREDTTALILDTTKRVRAIRQSYPPARPQIGRGV